ncbi:hypothetical protein [Streptococcus anginosus]|uniref:Uncharacterized protein n=1 Tax=Streptococcus anginosus TaxID=1328 RepID=A0A3S4QMS8_STRAP|nr:hypothetical protein [Streptococcus anginosus]EGL45850.1 hypothetical protein HMPREF9966_1363 [Streptococcus anginosus SK52 = DSM 20563]MBZ2158326.1 hypothetical protein [Streptococcus anginosus]ORE81269.1 hypothetical protein B6C93_08685 [Streptococcus anginosus SK52 = DSM 20563]UEB01604.1 hypothetical protein LK450_06580 [Streptococcus anginosus subsp. anginosus]VED98481.1 Uncharacterised protein [Streptococcus anginosus]
MEFFVNYVVPVLELIMSSIGVVFLFIPSNPSVSVDVGDKYYFIQNNNKSSNPNSTNQSDYGPALIVVVMIFATYLFYSLVGKLMIFIIMVISLIKVLRYKRLGIDYRLELIPPIISTIAFYTLNFLPSNVKEFWEINTKINFSKFFGLQSTVESILAPLPEFLKLFTSFEINRTRNISIFAILCMTLFVLVFEGFPIFQKKENLRISSKSFVGFYCIFLLILLGFAFYYIEQNPVRIVTEMIIKYLNN